MKKKSTGIKAVALTTAFIFAFSNSLALAKDSLRVMAVAERPGKGPLSSGIPSNESLQAAIRMGHWEEAGRISAQLAEETHTRAIDEKKRYYGTAPTQPKGTVLVTGAAGFIGAHTVEALLRQGYNVVGLDVLNFPYDPDAEEFDVGLLDERIYDPEIKGQSVQRFLGHPRFTFYGNTDIRDEKALHRLFEAQREKGEPVQQIIHLAALAGVRDAFEDPDRYLDIDVIGTSTVFRTALGHGVTNIVQASSSSVYGGSEEGKPSVEGDPLRPNNMYANAKVAAEGVATHYFNLSDGKLRASSMRFFTVWGRRGRRAMSLRKFVERMAANESIPIYADTMEEANEFSRNFTHVNDIVSGLIAALERPQPNEVFNLGGEEEMKLMRAITTLRKKLNDAGCPGQLRLELVGLQKGDVKASLASIEKAKRVLGFEPKMTMEKGLEDLAHWYLFWAPFKQAYDEYDSLVAAAEEGYSDAYFNRVLELRDRLEQLVAGGSQVAGADEEDSEYLVAYEYLAKTYQLIADITAHRARDPQEALALIPQLPQVPSTVTLGEYSVTLEDYMERTGITSRVTALLDLRTHPNICRCPKLSVTDREEYRYYRAHTLKDTWEIEAPHWHVEYPGGQEVDIGQLGRGDSFLIALSAGSGSRFRKTAKDKGRDKLLERLDGDQTMSGNTVEAARQVPGMQATIVVVTDPREMPGAEEVKQSIGPDAIYAYGLNGKGGTAYAAMQARQVRGVSHSDAVCVVIPGDKPGVRPATLQKVIDAVHTHDVAAATLTSSFPHPKVIKGKQDNAIKGSIPVFSIIALMLEHGEDAALRLDQIFPDEDVADDGSRYTPLELLRIAEVDAFKGIRKGRVVRSKKDGSFIGTLEVKDIQAWIEDPRTSPDAPLPLKQIFGGRDFGDDDTTYTPLELLEIEEMRVFVDAAISSQIFAALEHVDRNNNAREYYWPPALTQLLVEGKGVVCVHGSAMEAQDINTVEDMQRYMQLRDALPRLQAMGEAVGCAPEKPIHDMDLREIVNYATRVLLIRSVTAGEPVSARVALQAFSDGNWRHIPQLRAQLERSYGTDEAELERNAQRYVRTIQAAIDRGFASKHGMPGEDGDIIILRVPGRIKPIGNANDYVGAEFDSAAMATREDNIFIISTRDDDRMHLGTIDPGQFPDNNAYTVQDPALNPSFEIQGVDTWDTWFESVPDNQRPMPEGIKDRDPFWFAMPWAATAWVRGAEPDKRDNMKGYNFFVGDSTLPSTGGLSSSSNVFIGAVLGLNYLYGLNWSPQQLVEAGYAERGSCGTKGAIADHAAIVLCTLGQMGKLGLRPTEMKGQFALPAGLHMLIIDTGIDREKIAPVVSGKILKEAGQLDKSPDQRDEKAIDRTVRQIKTRGGLGGRLGLLYCKNAFKDRGIDFDYLRDLVADGKATAGVVTNGITEDEVRDVLRNLPARITKETLLAQLRDLQAAGLAVDPEIVTATIGVVDELQFPEEGLPLRGLVTYFIAGAAKVQEFFRAAEAGEIARMVEVAQSYHNGDRVVQWDLDTSTPSAYDGTPTDEDLNRLALWQLAGVRERSLEPMDWLVDRVEADTKGQVALMVSAAGLGGQMVAFVPEESIEAFQESVWRNLEEMALRFNYAEQLGADFDPAAMVKEYPAGQGATAIGLPRITRIGMTVVQNPPIHPNDLLHEGEQFIGWNRYEGALYGATHHPLDSSVARKRPHRGIDLHEYRVQTPDGSQETREVQAGLPVRAMAKGRVVNLPDASVVSSSERPFIRVIDHGDGWHSMYAHMDPTVNIGDEINAGDIIGTLIAPEKLDSLWRAHLHLEVYQQREGGLDREMITHRDPETILGMQFLPMVVPLNQVEGLRGYNRELLTGI